MQDKDTFSVDFIIDGKDGTPDPKMQAEYSSPQAPLFVALNTDSSLDGSLLFK
jgi:hypothetical protein